MMSIMQSRLRTMANHYEKRFISCSLIMEYQCQYRNVECLATQLKTNFTEITIKYICAERKSEIEREREVEREMELKYKNNQKRYKVLFHGPWNVSYKRRNYSRNHCVAHFDSNFGDIFDAVNKGHFPKLQCKSTWTAWIFMLLNATLW